jgi:CubicO group peptidase (beta-lactamase class C family)
VERVAKTDYNSFLQTRIFKKAGMSSSYLYTTRSDPGTALGYEAAANGASFVPSQQWDVSYLFSTGGIISTVTDILAWDRALQPGRLLSSASLQTMFAKPTLLARAVTHYAMGWVIGVNIIWHNGQLSGFHTMNGMFSDGYAVVVLGNESQLNGTPDLWVPENFAVAVHAVLNPNLVVTREPPTPASPALE